MKPKRACGGRCACSSRCKTISTARSGISIFLKSRQTSSEGYQPSSHEVTMTVTTNFFQQPRLRESVTLHINDQACSLLYRGEKYEIKLASETRTDATHLLELLYNGGHSIAEL